MHYTIQGIITLLNFFLYWTKITLKETIVCVDCEPMIDRCNEVQVSHCIMREIKKRWIYFGGYDGWYLTLTWWKIRHTAMKGPYSYKTRRSSVRTWNKLVLNLKSCSCTFSSVILFTSHEFISPQHCFKFKMHIWFDELARWRTCNSLIFHNWIIAVYNWDNTAVYWSGSYSLQLRAQ